MTERNCDICHGEEIFGVLPTIVESDIFRTALNPNQQHLGRVFVGLREHKPSLSELDGEEWVEYGRVVRVIEIGTRAAFDPGLFNWSCLMNNAARDGQETHVHWHGVPRYSRPVEFNGHTYTDDAWPRQYNTGHDPVYQPTFEEIIAITSAIRSGIRAAQLD